jgi:hypothetical protein
MQDPSDPRSELIGGPAQKRHHAAQSFHAYLRLRFLGVIHLCSKTHTLPTLPRTQPSPITSLCISKLQNKGPKITLSNCLSVFSTQLSRR